ncbi:bifunctional [glutamine synthetase] adenylyltransferase/[glutamine synthetase]-adenylyl-L-tyrosine phosphorylase [Ahrensia marina]|uniref:Bifunctional glutamine synthetase adenylyltransferase/adenylyl-removing enzyme n=1 Tax=Ahrensia marina TaxID=1514904 RepID=A0A0M9GP09_9HYPH|nr:bifunctional [glutamine synthetase] adenylyltransferase/[glutamine synthetase]-adenylyl-L-tyrosine phosphorylase [Ahrensia marina]KPB02293.1 bifunctional glutamine-synthetase adenylyltransferase/deadenyltransferase [Ahrensia marina]
MNASEKWFGKPPAHLFFANTQMLDEAKATLLSAARSAGAEKLAACIDNKDDALTDFLAKIMCLSPFLRSGILTFVEGLEAVCEHGLNNRIQSLVDDALQLGNSPDLSEAELMSSLRVLKHEAHILIALGDLAQSNSVATTTHFLSQLAENCLSSAVNWLLRSTAESGKIEIADLQNPSKDCGLVILGMGKLGGRELNYSSDIDIVIYFDLNAKNMKFAEGQDATEVMSRFVRRLVRIMQERTGDGYVFRTDLRLRPDPGATPLAVNVDAALHYYESRGQNWERAAFIKARPVAGDHQAALSFLNELKPFIWRKYLDYAAISDVQSIKRQIHAHKGHGKITVHGHNLKLGRGGIREVEFFVQTQQLIAGGRAESLRHRETVEMLNRLAEEHWIDVSVRDEMSAAYSFLRRAEHAVQMVADEQTHDLPKDDEELAVIAGLLGLEDVAAFSTELMKHLKIVEKHFGDLFEDEQTLSGPAGNLVFTGGDPDPDTLNNLSAMGFERAIDIWNIVRTWHFGRYRALSSAKAREQLTALLPSLLDSFAQFGQADETLIKFDKLLAGLPAGMQLFSMLNSNRQLLGLMSKILSSAPRLANIVTARPLIFDGMLEPAFFERMPDHSELQERLNFFVGEGRVYEDVLDRLRIFAAEQRFLIGVRMLTGSIDPQTTAKALSALADMLLEKALIAVTEEVEAKHGVIEGASMCLVALGKLGSREMTAGSDVDLILIYDAPDALAESDGQKPLTPSQYFARVTQRLIAALSAPTAEGVLYDVDFRLRPSGNKGPLATSLKAFSRYQREDAWTWEHMALTRARPVCGDPTLMEKFADERNEIICINREREQIVADIASMRLRLEKEKPAKSIWNLKMVPGGIVDIEFLTQYWMLTDLPNCKAGLTNRNLNAHGAGDILRLLNEEIIAENDRKELIEALDIYSKISQLIALCSAEKFDPQSAPKGLVEELCAATNMPDIIQLEAHLQEHSHAVRSIFEQYISLEQP